MRKYVTMALLALLPPVLSAARLTLRDGTVVYGQFISGSSQNIIFQDDNGVRRRFDLNQIRGLDFDSVTSPVGRDNGLNNDRPALDDNQRREAYYDQRNGANRSARTEVLPAGTSISVRTDQDINSQNTAEGHTFPGSIVQDVIDS